MENQTTKEKGKTAKQGDKTDSKKSSKRKGMSFSTNRIPKNQKASSSKFCQLCKEHGGPHKTQNTSDCLKFKKNGTKKKDFTKPLSPRSRIGIPLHSSPRSFPSSKTLPRKLRRNLLARGSIRKTLMIAIPTTNRKMGMVELGFSRK